MPDVLPVGAAVASAARPEATLLLEQAETPLDPEGWQRWFRAPNRSSSSKETNLTTALFDALSQCRSSLPERQRWRIARAIEEQSRRHGYDPLFVQAIIEVESTCSPTARSRRGAIGLVQLRPATARAVAKAAGIEWVGPQTLLDPVRNVELGLLYLNQLEQQFGDFHLAVAAYNLGPGRVARMPKGTARSARYVKKILARYEDLLASI